MAKCNLRTEVYSRVCGYHRPVSNWNEGKREEFKDRKAFDPLSGTTRIKPKTAEMKVA